MGAFTLPAAVAGGWWHDVRWFFTTIAVLLGTGILGLPVTLVHSGFAPFAAVFTVTLGMQAAVVLLATDLLQRARAHLAAGVLGAAEGGAGGAGSSGGEGGGGGGGAAAAAAAASPAALHAATALTADLHTMGRMYLHPALARLFDAAVLLTFISTLISYSLAGAAAYGQLAGASVAAVIAPFVLACTAAILAAPALLQPAVSALTLVKVTVLVVIIGLCGSVAAETGVRPHASWDDMLQPFLVGTVAIGGIADLMPMMFDAAAHSRATIARFRNAVCAGVGACYVLNLLWASFVLGIVPQTRADAAAAGGSVSLEAAAAAGQIATVPVTAVINARDPQYAWLATAITVFITLSITVSFNAIGLGLKHVLDGVAAAVAGRFVLTPADAAAAAAAADGPAGIAHRDIYASLTVRHALHPSRLCARAARAWADPVAAASLATRGALYAASFGTILGVALADPSGFLVVLETATSMALNMAGGVFVALMYLRAREVDVRLAAGEAAAAARGGGAGRAAPAGEVPLPLPERAGRALAAFVLLTFSVAVLYDVHNSFARVLPDTSAGWLTGTACVMLWAAMLKPAAASLWRGPAAAVAAQEGAAAAAAEAATAASRGSGKRESERTGLISGGASAPFSAGAAASPTATTPAAALAGWLSRHFHAVYDAALLASVAWTHAGLDGELHDAIAALAIVLVGTHQLLMGEGAAEEVVAGRADLAGRVDGAGRRRGALALLHAALVVLADGFAPLSIASLSIDAGQVGAGVLQMLLAAASAFLLLARCCTHRLGSAGRRRGGVFA
jgi:amino acid permease